MASWLKPVVAVSAIVSLAGAAWFQIQHLRGTRPRVWTEPVRQRDVLTTITATGSVGWGRGTTLSSPEDGRVRNLLATRGQRVRAGQAVVVLDDRPMRLALARALAGVASALADVGRAQADVDRLHAERELARLSRRRTEQLFANGTAAGEAAARRRNEAHQAELAYVAGLEAVSAARARARSADADRVDAESRRARHTIRAPSDGVVTEVFVRTGQPVHGGSTSVPPSRLLTLAAAVITDIEVPTDIRGAARLWPGARASAGIPALGAQGLDAHIVAVAHGDPHQAAGGTATIRVRLDSPQPGLRPGMSATVRFLVASQPHTLAVPNHAVAGGGGGVWTIRNGVIALVPIVLGLRGDFYSEVLAGLSPGMPVVTGPAAVIETLGIGDRAVAVPAPIRAP